MITKRTGKPVAALIAGTISIITIGILHLLAESNDMVHDFLPFIKPMGGLSGKITIAYSLGILSYFILRPFLKNKNLSIKKWFYIFVLSILLASLFVYTPFVKLIVGLLFLE